MATTNTVNARAVGNAKPSARERLLAAADELFYAEGVRTVGIDRVIEQAGVAKASLYNTFGSKEALIHAYLEGRHAKTAARIARYIERYEAPRERLLAVFESQAEQFADPGFRGCAFAAASAEAHSGDQVEQASAVYRAWIRQLFTELAEQAAVADAAGLARQLQLIYDGSGLSARMDHDPEVSRISRDTAAILLDAAPKAER